MEDNRYEKRRRARVPGFFAQGKRLCEIELRDYHTKGIGAYASMPFTPGQKGTLMARLPDSSEMEHIAAEIRWCAPDSAHSVYEYRMGLMLLNFEASVDEDHAHA